MKKFFTKLNMLYLISMLGFIVALFSADAFLLISSQTLLLITIMKGDKL